MRKLLILLILILYATPLYSADIDVGSAATDRGTSLNNFTMIDKNNPANDTGTIDSIDVYTDTTGKNGDFEFASFADEGSNALSTNGVSGSINAVTGQLNSFSAPGDFTAFNINIGEYIGIETAGGNLCRCEVGLSGGVGMWYNVADDIPASSVTFDWIAGYAVSVYAEGTVAAAGNPVAAETWLRGVVAQGVVIQ